MYFSIEKLIKHILSFFVKVPEIKAASNNLTDACYDENGQLHGFDLFIRTDVRTAFVSIEENLEGGKSAEETFQEDIFCSLLFSVYINLLALSNLYYILVR